MALKGQRQRFAEAVIAAKPLKLSNKEIALLIGCSETSASASGSRCAADKDVRQFILEHWPNYYDADNLTQLNNEAAPQHGLPFFDAESVLNWLETLGDEEILQKIFSISREKVGKTGTSPLNAEGIKEWMQGINNKHPEFKEVVQAACMKLGATTDLMEYWDSVLINPYSSPKEKAQAAADKAKYTLAKPAAVGKKDSALEAAMAARARKRQDNAIGDMFEQSALEDTGYKPRWQN